MLNKEPHKLFVKDRRFFLFKVILYINLCINKLSEKTAFLSYVLICRIEIIPRSKDTITVLKSVGMSLEVKTIGTFFLFGIRHIQKNYCSNSNLYYF